MDKKINDLIEEIKELCDHRITSDWGKFWGEIEISAKFQNGVEIFVKKTETQTIKK